MQSASKVLASGLIQAGVPVHFVSGSAGGKTSFMKLVAQSLGYHYIRISLGPREPTDLHGFMIHQGEDVLSFGKPPHLIDLRRAVDSGKRVLFHLDEFDSCQPTLQVAVLDLVGDYILGDMQLPRDRVSFVATGNPVAKAANGHQLADALFKRFVNLRWNVELDDWLEGLMTDFSLEETSELPDNWRLNRLRSKQLVTAFLKAKSSHHDSQVEPEHETDSKPNHRAWSWFVVDIVSVAKSLNWPDELMAQAIIGAVGQAAGTEFMHYIKALDLPMPQEVLADPERYHIDPRPDIIFTVAHSCVALTLEQPGLYWPQCKKLVTRLTKDGFKDIAFTVFRKLADYYNSQLTAGNKGLESLGDLVKANPEFQKFIRTVFTV